MASFFFLMVGVCLRIFAAGDVTSYGANLLVEMFIVVAAAFWAMHLVLTGRMAWVRSPINILIAIFFVLTLVHALCAPHLQRSITTFIDWSSSLLVFFLVIQFCIARRWARIFIYTLIACAVVISLYGIFQYHYLFDYIAWRLQTSPAEVLKEMDLPMMSLDDLFARVMSKRVYATFANPNSFAGFLLMTIPLSVGMLIDACRRRSGASLWEGAAMFLAVTLQVHALALTFSKGGFVTFIVMAVLFVVMASWRLVKAHRKWLLPAAAVALLAVSAGAVKAIRAAHSDDTSFPPAVAAKLRSASESMEVRIGYWGAGLRMIADHPLLGVGLDNFADRYSEYKLPTGREVKRAHNDYLQVAAELGVPGLIVFCALWAGLVGASVPRERIPHAPPEGRESFWAALGAGALSFITATMLLNMLETFPSGGLSILACAVLLVFWLTMFLFVGAGVSLQTGGRASNDLWFARIGIAVGLVGFLIHCTVDYDLYVPGCGQTAWMLAALALALREPRPAERMIRVKPALKWSITVAAVVVCAIFIVPGVGIVIRAFEAESALSQAKQKRNEMPMTRENLLAAVEFCEQSIERNPLDDDARYVLAQCYETLWMLRDMKDDQAFCLAIESFREVLKLNPSHCAALYRIAEVYRDAAHYEKGLLFLPVAERDSGDRLSTIEFARQRLGESAFGKGLGLDNSAIDASFIPYVWAMREAVESYPTNPHYRVALGNALHLAGLDDAAAVQYAKALEYDRVAPIDRLRLSEDVRKLAEKRAGG